MGMTQRDVMGREVGGGSCLGMHVRIKDFKILKNKKNKNQTKKKKKQTSKFLVWEVLNLYLRFLYIRSYQ